MFVFCGTSKKANKPDVDGVLSMTRRARRLTLTTVAVGFAVLVVAAVAGKDRDGRRRVMKKLLVISLALNVGIYVSWYEAGVLVFDITDPTGRYDTYAGPLDPVTGCWGVYPFLGPDRILASDTESGLYVAFEQDIAHDQSAGR